MRHRPSCCRSYLLNSRPINMFSTIMLPLAIVALLPLTNAIILLGTSTAATASTIGITVGSGGAVAVAGAAAVVGALVLGGIALAAASSRRGKRDASIGCLPVDNPDLFITLAANSDQFGCGLRLVCELESTQDEALSKEEKLILSLFGRHIKPVSFSEMKLPKSSFQYAALIGSQAKNISECAEVFDQCPFDRITMMQAFVATK